jgi:phosphate-selective porin OprO and OprP
MCESQALVRTILAVVLGCSVLAGPRAARAADDLFYPDILRPAPLVVPPLPTTSINAGATQSATPAALAPPATGADANAATTSTDKQAAETDEFPLRFKWKNGLVGETPDKDFRIHVGGRMDFDSGWYSAPANIQNNLGSTPLLDGTDLRRFRFRTDGTIWEQMDFALEADFSKAADFKELQSTPQTNIFITDAWIALRDLPWVDTVRIGHQKEYMTFSNATSANFETFMERPYIFDAFEDSFSYDNGISTNRTYLDEHATSWLGVFWNGTRSQAYNVAGGYAVTGRLTALPIYEDDGQHWLDLGISGSWRSSSQPSDPTTVTVRPLVRTGESFQVPNLIDSGELLSRDGLQIAGTGIQTAWGRWTFSSEFLCWNINNAYTGSFPNANGTLPAGAASVGNLFFSGFYVEMLYFLTPGDYHPINRVIPGYDRVIPAHNFFYRRHDSENHERGLGAWEVGVRYDHVDANSGLVQAGRLDSITVGLNWYLNPNARFMINYVYTNMQAANPAGDGNFSSLGVRFHLDL